MTNPIDVLVIEDGDEYLSNLSTFVADGMRYRQAKSGAEARVALDHGVPDLVYLDMRFDRIPEEDLLGDVAGLTARFNGDLARARRFQQDNQGLFILHELRHCGYVGPVVLSYDFAGEERRFRALASKDPALLYCPDYADSKTIRATILQAVKDHPKASR